jgi:replicative DNA helicase
MIASNASFDRLLPYDLQAEAALLASMMLNGDCVPEVMRDVDRSALYLEEHQMLFDAIAGLWERRRAIDLVTVRDELVKRGLLEEVGGYPFIAEVAASVPTAAHWASYSAAVREKAILRRIVKAADRAIQACYAPHEDAAAVYAAAAASFAEIPGAGSDMDSITISDAMRAGLGEQGEPRDFVPTGLPGLDEALGGGLDRGEFAILAARPSMGKTTIARQIAMAAARAGYPALYISLEELRGLFGRKAVSMESGIENKRIRAGGLAPQEWEEAEAAIKAAQGVPLYLNDRVRKLADIRTCIARHVARDGLRLVLIDYLGLIDGVEGNEYEQNTRISKRVAGIVREFNVAALCLHQLNRGAADGSRRPGMSDLRGSGQFEQDANTILMLHREDYYHLNEPGYQRTGEAELIIEKAKDGERGQVVTFKSNLKNQRFIDPATEWASRPNFRPEVVPWEA